MNTQQILASEIRPNDVISTSFYKERRVYTVSPYEPSSSLIGVNLGGWSNIEFRLTDKVTKHTSKPPLQSLIEVPNVGVGAMLGSDPEVFVCEGRRLFPSWKFMPSKELAKPKKDADSGLDIKTFYDGFQSEMAFDKGVGCLSWLVDGVQRGLTDVYNTAKAYTPNATLTPQETFKLTKAHLKSPIEFLKFGCEPSYNIYTSQHLECCPQLPYRFAGSHMHFGFGFFPHEIPALIYQLDCTVGLCLTASIGHLENPIRRQFYGKAGEYRSKHPNRLEYRTPSSWMLSHPAIYHVMFTLAREALKWGKMDLAHIWKTSPEDVQIAINQSDSKLARQILSANIDTLKNLLNRYYTFKGSTVYWDSFHKLIFEGIESIVAEPHNMLKNWRISPADWKSHSESPNSNWTHASHTISEGQKI